MDCSLFVQQRRCRRPDNHRLKNVELNINHRQTCIQHLQCLHTRRSYCYPQFVRRLGLEATLEGHSGCVNCVQWNDEGTVLASGSDDHCVILWNAFTHKQMVKVHTGHSNNIFSVQFVPRTNDRVVMSAAGDSKVRMHNVEGRQGDQCMQVYSCHTARVKRLAVNGAEPHLVWSAGEDGMVMEWDVREPVTCAAKGKCNHVLVNLCAHVGNMAEVKCVASNPCRSEQLAVGATDEFARVYDRRMLRRHVINVTHEYNRLRNLWSASSAHLEGNHWQVESETYEHPLSAATYYAAGHLPLGVHSSPRRSRQLATTHLTFSQDGRELLVNLGGEQLYLFPVVNGTSGGQADSCIRTLSRVSALLRSAGSDAPSGGAEDNSPTCSKRSRHQNGTNGFHIAADTDSARRPSTDQPLSPRVECLKRQANSFFEQKQYSSAISLYSEAILYAPDTPVLYANRATAYCKRGWSGDVYAALRDCFTVLSQQPDHVKAWFRLARCLHQLNLPNLAWQTLKVFKQRFPDEYAQDACARLLLDVKSAMFSNGQRDPGNSEFSGTKNGHRKGTASESDGKHHDVDRCLATALEEADASGSDDFSSGAPTSDTEQMLQSQAIDYAQRFCGHCNTTTDIKEANFLGENDDYIVAGSDDGSFFVWSRQTCNIVAILKGDQSIVNCLQPHPNTLLMATSGIESVVKLWSPRPDDGTANPYLITDFDQSAAANQRRMNADPLETMLLNIGYRLGGEQEAMPQVQCRQS